MQLAGAGVDPAAAIERAGDQPRHLLPADDPQAPIAEPLAGRPLGFQLALWTMAGALALVLAGVVLALPREMGRAKASRSAGELFAKSRAVNGVGSAVQSPCIPTGISPQCGSATIASRRIAARASRSICTLRRAGARASRGACRKISAS